MRLLLILQGIILVIHFLINGMSFGFIFNVIGRILFAGKLLGMKIKLGAIATLEAIGLMFLLLIPFIFGTEFSWWYALTAVLSSSASLAIAWYDDKFYVYDEREV